MLEPPNGDYEREPMPENIISQLCIKCKEVLPPGAKFCPACGRSQQPQTRKHRKRANGTGTICKLPGNRRKPWQARKNGVSIGTYETRAEAQKALERLTDTNVTEKFNMTFADVYERWMAEHRREISDKMRANYELAFKQCQQLHTQPIRRLMRSDFQAAIIALESEGKAKSTCNKLRTMLHQVCEYAQGEGILTGNPAADLNTVAQQKSTREIFTDDDIKKLHNCKLPAAQIALIMISCGCRPGELFSAPLSNCAKDHIIWGSKTAAGKNRVIPIGSDGVDAYQTMILMATINGGTKLIDGYQGRNHTAENFTKREWRELMEAIGREGLTPYSCRHTFITRAIRSGMDLITLESIVGHVDKETTKLYTHLKAKDLVAAVRKTSAVDYKLATQKKQSG